jgi:hypothetical protein
MGADQLRGLAVRRLQPRPRDVDLDLAEGAAQRTLAMAVSVAGDRCATTRADSTIAPVVRSAAVARSPPARPRSRPG